VQRGGVTVVRAAERVAVVGVALALTGCAAPPTLSDAAADAPRDVAPVAADAGDDGGASAGCPAVLPLSGVACATDRACVYGASGCVRRFGYRRCTCVDARWRCACTGE
jgi:hypothetical protein